MESDQASSPVIKTRGHVEISSLWNLFTGFLLIGMFGFGGIAAAMFHVVVERRHWMSVEDYASSLGLSQVLPGASLINMGTIIADRYRGLLGVVVALTGVMVMPIVILLLLVTSYDHYQDLPDVQSAIKAAAAAAVGLTFGMGIKLGLLILKSPTAILIASSCFVAIGIFRFPMLSTVLVIAPIAIGAGFWNERK